MSASTLQTPSNPIAVALAAERRAVAARQNATWRQSFSFAKDLYAKGPRTDKHNTRHVVTGLQPHAGLHPHAGLFPSGDRVVD